MTTQQMVTGLLADTVALIEERLRDIAERGLSAWDGQPSLLVIEEPLTDPEDLKALDFVRRYGRKAGIGIGKSVEVDVPGEPRRDDPRLDKAMGVWGYLDDRERRETFRTLYRHVLAHKQTGDVDYLIRFAESIDLMVRLESANPGLRDRIRASRNQLVTAADPKDVEALIKKLEGRS